MVSADLPGSKATHFETVAKELPKMAKNKVKSFARSMLPKKPLIAKFASGSKKMTDDGQVTTTPSVEPKSKGIRRIIRADSLKAKESIRRLFRSHRSKKQEGVQVAASVNSASETPSEKATSLEITDHFTTASCNGDVEGGDPEKLPSHLGTDPLQIQNARVEISPLETSSYIDPVEPSMATDAEFLKSVDATLSYGQVDFEASGMPAINFAAVIYGEEGFSIAGHEPNRKSDATAEKSSVPSANTAYTQSYVPTRQRAPSDGSYSSQNSSVKTRVFSFMQMDDDSDQSSVTDSSDDEMNYISVRLPRTRIFKKKSKYHTTCRVRTSMPDLYGTDSAAVQTIPEAAPVHQLRNSDILQPENKSSENDVFSDLISKIDDLVSDQPVPKTSAGIADISPNNVSAIDGEESVAPLRRSSTASPKCKRESTTDEIEASADKCHHQLYMSDEWTATEELFYEIEHLTTFTGSFQNQVSKFSKGDEKVDTVAVNEEKFAQFVDAIERATPVGDPNASEEADTFINAVYGYQQVFCHLIKNIIAPGNERLYKLLKDFLYVRSSEGELVLEAERIRNKLNQIHEEGVAVDSTIQSKVLQLSSSFRKVESRFQRGQRELARLQKEFSKEIPSVLEFISKLGSVRARVLDAWNMLHNISDSTDLFESYDILNSIYKEEYETMTSWHSTAPIGEIAHLLVKDLAILVDCNSMLSTMLSSLRTTVDAAERDIVIPC